MSTLCNSLLTSRQHGKLKRWQRTKWFISSTYKHYTRVISVSDMINKIEKKDGVLWLLGMRFAREKLNSNHNVSKLRDFLSSLRRITYVDRFVSRGRVMSDADWGCTIRAGQMLVCNAFIQKLGFEIYSHKDTDLFYQLFINGQLLAIQYFIESIEDREEAAAGERWAADRFTSTLKLLIQGAETEKNLTNCQKQPLQLSIFSNIGLSLGIVNFNGYVRCSKLKSLLNSFTNLFVFVHLGINDEKIDSNSKLFLYEVMKLSSFSGMIGSKGAEAYYIFGHDEDMFFFLDPHEISKEKDLNSPKTYQVNAVSQIKYAELEHAVTVCFAVAENNIQKFHADIQRLSDIYQVIGVFGFDEAEETLQDSIENISAYDINQEFLRTYFEDHMLVSTKLQKTPQNDQLPKPTKLPPTAQYIHGFFVQSTFLEDPSEGVDTKPLTRSQKLI